MVINNAVDNDIINVTNHIDGSFTGPYTYYIPSQTHGAFYNNQSSQTIKYTEDVNMHLVNQDEGAANALTAYSTYQWNHIIPYNSECTAWSLTNESQSMVLNLSNQQQFVTSNTRGTGYKTNGSLISQYAYRFRNQPLIQGSIADMYTKLLLFNESVTVRDINCNMGIVCELRCAETAMNLVGNRGANALLNVPAFTNMAKCSFTTYVAVLDGRTDIAGWSMADFGKSIAIVPITNEMLKTNMTTWLYAMCFLGYPFAELSTTMTVQGILGVSAGIATRKFSQTTIIDGPTRILFVELDADANTYNITMGAGNVVVPDVPSVAVAIDLNAANFSNVSVIEVMNMLNDIFWDYKGLRCAMAFVSTLVNRFSIGTGFDWSNNNYVGRVNSRPLALVTNGTGVFPTTCFIAESGVYNQCVSDALFMGFSSLEAVYVPTNRVYGIASMGFNDRLAVMTRIYQCVTPTVNIPVTDPDMLRCMLRDMAYAIKYVADNYAEFLCINDSLLLNAITQGIGAVPRDKFYALRPYIFEGCVRQPKFEIQDYVNTIKWIYNTAGADIGYKMCCLSSSTKASIIKRPYWNAGIIDYNVGFETPLVGVNTHYLQYNANAWFSTMTRKLIKQTSTYDTIEHNRCITARMDGLVPVFYSSTNGQIGMVSQINMYCSNSNFCTIWSDGIPTYIAEDSLVSPTAFLHIGTAYYPTWIVGNRASVNMITTSGTDSMVVVPVIGSSTTSSDFVVDEGSTMAMDFH